jgi:hypothetical protein
VKGNDKEKETKKGNSFCPDLVAAFLFHFKEKKEEFAQILQAKIKGRL